MTRQNILKVVWQLARPYTLVLIVFHGIFFLLINLFMNDPHQTIGVVQLIFAALAISCAYICAVAINDYSDVETDSINLKNAADRPIINKSASKQKVFYIYVIASVLCIIFSWLVQPWLAWVAVIIVILSYFYSMPPIRISSRGMMAQLLLPLVYIVFPSTCAIAITGYISIGYVLLTVAMYIIFIGRLFPKDIRDEKGDRATGKMTYVVRHGANKALIQSAIWTTVGYILFAIFLIIFTEFNWVITIVITVVSLVGSIIALHQCYFTKKNMLLIKLLYLGVYGRWISGRIVVFSTIIIAEKYSGIAQWRQITIVLLMVAIILTSIAQFYQIINRTKHRLEKV